MFTLQNEEFVCVLKKGDTPHTRFVRGSNYCHVNVFADRNPGKAIIISVVCPSLHGRLVSNLSICLLLSTLLLPFCRSITLSREHQGRPYRTLTWWWDTQRTRGFSPSLSFLDYQLAQVTSPILLPHSLSGRGLFASKRLHALLVYNISLLQGHS